MSAKRNPSRIATLLAFFFTIILMVAGCQKKTLQVDELPIQCGVVAETELINRQHGAKEVASNEATDVESINDEIRELMLTRNYEKAVELLDATMRHHENDLSNKNLLTTFLFDVTYCQVMLEHAEKAIPYIEKACQLFIEDDHSFFLSACVFHRLERYDEAITRYQKAIELRKKINPYFFSSEEQHYCWGLFMAYNNKGDLRNAYDVYKKVKDRLDGYQFHVEPPINDLIQYMKEINDDNWETMPRFRVSKRLPPHPVLVDSPPESDQKRIKCSLQLYFEPIDVVSK